MAPHPSLTAPKLTRSHDPLKPVEKMGRNELCWCRSGKKYKKCHLNREDQKKINAYELEQRMFTELREGYCSHPAPSSDNPCSTIITKAHTVQKNGGLAAIAEAGHVLTVKPVMKEMIKTEGNPQPRKIGVKLASVFPGFCNYHDTTIFKPIEGKTLTLKTETAFLFSYRAVAYERFSKEVEHRITLYSRKADRGMPFWKQDAIQSYLHDTIIGLEIGMRDVNCWKDQFDNQLLSGSHNDFHFVAIRFDRILPIVACCAFHPEFDLNGTHLQQLGQDRFELDHVTLTVTTFEENTVVVFGWIGPQNGPARTLAKSLLAIDDSRKADALVRLLFIHTDNVFLRPSWWAALPKNSQEVLNDMTRSGTQILKRSGAEFADASLKFITADIVDTVSG
jgi:hypothetical protein